MCTNIMRGWKSLDGAEDWKEWHYQFLIATHAYSMKNGMLLEIIEQKEIDDVTPENVEIWISAGGA